MKLRRGVFVVAILSLLSALPVPAQAGTENPYWEVKTNVPVETIQGGWTVAEDGFSATLEFAGTNVTGQETTFTAGWLSPWVRKSHQEEGGFSFIGDPTTNGKLTVMTRVQVKGHEWGPWFKLRMRWRDLSGGYLWAGGASSSSRGLVRYDWKLIGTVSGNSLVDGTAEISVE